MGNDVAADLIASLLCENHTIQEIDLQSNRFTSLGAISIARGLAKNEGVHTINLRNQPQKFGEECIEAYKDIFVTNLTLTKIVWDVDARSARVLGDYMARNFEIARRKVAGKDVQDELPVKTCAMVTLAKRLSTPSSPACDSETKPTLDVGEASITTALGSDADESGARQQDETEVVGTSAIEESDAAAPANDESYEKENDEMIIPVVALEEKEKQFEESQMPSELATRAED